MPIYEYECNKCKNVFETIMSTSDSKNGEKTNARCTQCGSTDIRKCISALGGIKANTDSIATDKCQSRGGFS